MSQGKGIQTEKNSLTEKQTGIFSQSDLELIDWGPLTLERAICFAQSTNLNINLIKNHPRWHTQQIYGNPEAQLRQINNPSG